MTTENGTNGPKHRSIGAIMAGFKSVTTKRINQMRGMRNEGLATQLSRTRHP